MVQELHGGRWLCFGFHKDLPNSFPHFLIPKANVLMNSSGIKQMWACLGCHIFMKTWGSANINVIYTLCVLDTTVSQRGMAVTDDQESHSGNEVLI